MRLQVVITLSDFHFARDVPVKLVGASLDLRTQGPCSDSGNLTFPPSLDRSGRPENQQG